MPAICHTNNAQNVHVTSMLQHTVCFSVFNNLYLSFMPVSRVRMYFCSVISMHSKHITEINIAFTCLMAWIQCSLEGLSKVSLMEMKLRVSRWKGRLIIFNSCTHQLPKLSSQIKSACRFFFYKQLTGTSFECKSCCWCHR